MKMDKATIEIILFDNGDILTASIVISEDTNTSGIPIIWLTSKAVNNFNKMTSGAGTLSTLFYNVYPIDSDFYAYSGDGFSNGFYFLSAYHEEPQTKPLVFNDLDYGDYVKYEVILDWLSSHGQKVPSAP